MKAGSPPQRTVEPGSARAEPTEPRLALRKPLMVLNVKGGAGSSRTLFGYATNISRAGFMVPATWPKEPGSQFHLQLTLPEPMNLDVQAHCEVVWSRAYSKRDPVGPGMGLRFLDLPPETAEAIGRWIERESRAEALRHRAWR